MKIKYGNFNKENSKKILNMKAIIFFFVLFFVLNSVYAGEIREIDVSNDGTFPINLKVEDAIEFYFMDGRHIITLDKIHKDGTDINIFLFVNRGQDQKVSYMTVNKERTIKLDLDKDGVGELFVGLQRLLKDDEARIFIYNPPDEDRDDLEDTTGRVVAVPDIPPENTQIKNKGVHWFFGIVIGVLLLALLVTLAYNTKN